MIVLTFELFIGHFTGQNMVSHLEEKIANSEALLFECIKELNNIPTRTSALFDMLGPLLVFFPPFSVWISQVVKEFLESSLTRKLVGKPLNLFGQTRMPVS